MSVDVLTQTIETYTVPTSEPTHSVAIVVGGNVYYCPHHAVDIDTAALKLFSY